MEENVSQWDILTHFPGVLQIHVSVFLILSGFGTQQKTEVN